MHQTTSEPAGAFAPLRQPVFRNLWLTSLGSNFGQLILGVGAAWEMMHLTRDASLIALVQTALMLPLMLIAVPGGAIADMYDRRKVALAGLGFATICGIVLTTLSFLGMLTPWTLLAFCVLIGSGVALFSPAWQASIREQVSPALLPAAIALGSVSYNIARSVGPAVGGVIVATAGARAAFGVTAVSFLPILVAFLLWRRPRVPNRLPRERIDRAILGGMRYAFHSSAIRTALVRMFLFGLGTASYSALAPLLARDQLGGGAATYGILLCATGLGAILGALLINRARMNPGPELSARLCTIVTGLAIMGMGLSHSLVLTIACYFVTGTANILMIGLVNITVQFAAPRWVTARVLSLFSSSITGGIAVGAIIWGHVVESIGDSATMLISGAAVLLTLGVMVALPLREIQSLGLEAATLHGDPEVALDLSMRSGPVIIEIDFRVDPDDARNFYNAMLALHRTRKRNGASNWSISRDISDPWRWTERYECPTWGDYLRMRERRTLADAETYDRAEAFNSLTENRIRRNLERPFGSVRWDAETPDGKEPRLPYFAP